MPMYDYRCSCGATYELLRKKGSRNNPHACACGQEAKRVPSLFSMPGARYVDTKKFDFSVAFGKKFDSSKDVDKYAEKIGCARTNETEVGRNVCRSESKLTLKELAPYLQ